MTNPAESLVALLDLGGRNPVQTRVDMQHLPPRIRPRARRNGGVHERSYRHSTLLGEAEQCQCETGHARTHRLDLLTPIAGAA